MTQDQAPAKAKVDAPRTRPRYTLDELLAQCDPNAERSAEDQAWLDAPAVGRERIFEDSESKFIG